MLEFVTVGHVTLDRITRERGNRLHWIPGGPAVHTSFAAASLGAKTYIVSKIGTDFGKAREKWLKRKVNTSFLKVTQASTTKFEIRYSKGSRSLRLLSKCENLDQTDLPKGLRIRSLHLGPVIDEIPEAVAESFASQSTVTSLDPQGYVRRIGRGGAVLLKRWCNRRLLKRVDVLRGSTDEMRLMAGSGGVKWVLRKLRRLGPSVCILTRSGRGSILLSDEGLFRIPAYEPEMIVDPTGAGDTFTGSFLLEYANSGDAVWSACVGAAAASIKVERSGPCLIQDRKRLTERATAVNSKVRRAG